MSDAPGVNWRVPTACAALLAVLFGLQAYINNAQTPTEITLSFAMSRAFIVWTSWLVLAPLIDRAGRTNPLGTESWGRWIWKHFWLATGFAAVHSVMVAVFRQLVGIPATADIIDSIITILVVNFAGDVLRYSLISLAYQAWAYHRTVRERDAQAAKLKIDLAEAKLAALEGRLRPHFLFNTLNAIAALIREEPAAAEEMVGQLSDLLRASLKADPLREVTLADELRLVEQYLAIEQTRFQSRLVSAVDVTEMARLAYVPHLILQPLVENAVRHGISPRESGGSIWVRGDQIGDRLVITIEDDGVGIGNAPPELAGSGVGLGSVRSRLAHLYAADQTLDVEARRPTGTRVRIEIPFRAAGEPAVALHS